MKRNPAVVLLLAACTVAAALYIGRFAAPAHGVFASALSQRSMMIIGGWTKLAALVMAAAFAFRSALALGSDNGAYRAWMLLASGLTSYALGQATLVSYQTLTGVSPFPSVGDVFFIAAYPLLIAALVMFTLAYARSGFPTDGLVAVAAGTSLVAVGMAWPLLAPIARTPAEPLALFLNLAYPLLDLALLVPAVVLLALTVRFRGGAIWRIWAALLAGIVFTILGDIGFAWLSSLGYQHIDPLVHAMYIIAYGSLAVGTSVQYRLVAPQRPVAANLATA